MFIFKKSLRFLELDTKHDKTRKAFTFSASSPAWMTGPNTVSVSLVSANISGIWSSKLEKQAASN